MKNKKLLVFGAIALFALIIIGGVLLLLRSSSSETGKIEDEFNENYIELSAEDVGLVLYTQQNNQQFVMELTKLSEIKSFDYDVSYDTIEDGQVVKQGKFGSGPNPDEKGESSIIRVMDLGTCSATCRYHKGIEEIEFVLRVNLLSGEVGIIEEIYILE